MAETAVRGKPMGGRGFRVILAVLVGCFVLAAAVGVGAFDDDEGGTHEPGTDALRAGGILEDTECGPGRICPTEPMLRWVMAVWLVRAVDGADPAGAASGRFSDVSPNEWWATHVERLAELEVTLGCGDGTGFCPADAVTRAQMATFLVRAFGLDADGGSGFGDIAGNTHEASINILAAERVTAGCSTSPLRYCPNRSVTRGQMATFLARALNLIPLPDPPRNDHNPPNHPTHRLHRNHRGREPGVVGDQRRRRQPNQNDRTARRGRVPSDDVVTGRNPHRVRVPDPR